jgi:hypothetical protein
MSLLDSSDAGVDTVKYTPAMQNSEQTFTQENYQTYKYDSLSALNNVV